jgi:tetratricopeptide (TPR) repeat protein
MSKFRKKYKQLKEQIDNLSPQAKRVLIAGGVLLLIIVVSCILLIIASQRPLDDDSGLTGEEKALRDANVKQAQREGAIRDNAEKAIEKGDVQEVSNVYSEAIKSETNIPKKIQLYIDQSGVLYAAGKYKEAIEVAILAEPISDDQYLVADWLSRLYEDQHEYKLAAQYYTTAGKWATSEMNKTRLNKDYYDRQALRVTALVGQQ